MEFDFAWLLWALPLAFGLGWLASRFDMRQLRIESRQNPKAYFRGLNHLLNEQQDEAVDAFIEAVQKDPDTSELHFALGNLFRRRGDYDRAVRVHEHLLARGDLNTKDRQRAQEALAQDFVKAGLLDRAERALLQLQHTPFAAKAQLTLLSIYERTRDWDKAATLTTDLEHTQQGTFRLRLAHYRCEQALVWRHAQRTTEALKQLETLVQHVVDSPRAWIELADLRHSLNHTQGAWDALQAMLTNAPSHMPLVAHNYAIWARVLGHQDVAREQLTQWQRDHTPSIDVTQALVTLSEDPSEARALYLEHLQREPSLVAAHLWLGTDALLAADAALPVRQALDRAIEPCKRYRCAACGFEARQYFWQCPGCQTWDSYPPLRSEEL